MQYEIPVINAREADLVHENAAHSVQRLYEAEYQQILVGARCQIGLLLLLVTLGRLVLLLWQLTVLGNQLLQRGHYFPCGVEQLVFWIGLNVSISGLVDVAIQDSVEPIHHAASHVGVPDVLVCDGIVFVLNQFQIWMPPPKIVALQSHGSLLSLIVFFFNDFFGAAFGVRSEAID